MPCKQVQYKFTKLKILCPKKSQSNSKTGFIDKPHPSYKGMVNKIGK